MAEIYRSLAGQTDSPEILTTKGFGALVISSTRAVNEFTTEAISIWVEKEGKNIDICKDVLLKDLVLLGTWGEDCILCDATFKTIANVDLTEDGGFISLKDNETIKCKLRGLIGTVSYVLNGIEEPVPSHEVTMYERKSMASEDVNRDFDTKGYDIVSLQNDATINEISLTFDNGSVCKYTPFELSVVARSIDQMLSLTQAGTIVQTLTDRVVFPIKGVVNMNVRKTPGTRLDVTMRIDESDWELYQMAKR